MSFVTPIKYQHYRMTTRFRSETVLLDLILLIGNRWTIISAFQTSHGYDPKISFISSFELYKLN